MFLVGDSVQVTPRTSEARKFWAFVDGWVGTIQSTNSGRMVVICHTVEGEKTLFVEPENLTKLHRIP